jgi:5-methylcytosine-specific restriction endonuclease McrBC GTP-binding regulatory subunit McrB
MVVRLFVIDIIIDATYDKYGNVYIPQNLYIVGNVNMDETTFPFSKKVLDRANTIGFNKVDV